jgi:uncharacterized protein YebE (UPF0316 family)
MKLLIAVFGLGVLTDFLVAKYYLALTSRHVLAAVILSILVTVIPLIVAERGINAKRVSVFVAYALGCGAGTALGLMISV